MLNINNGGGDFTPYIKYNAKAGRYYVKKDGVETEVQNPVFVADFENIKTGWFYFKAGVAPERIFDPSLAVMAPKPERTYTNSDGKVRDCFSRGFTLNLFSQNMFGGVVELSSTSNAMATPMNALYEEYVQNKQDGKLPVVECTGVKPITNDHGTNYEPVFKISKWVDRPVEFDSKESDRADQPSPAPQQPQQAPVNNTVSEF